MHEPAMRVTIEPGHRGGFWLRAVATIIDGFCLLIPNVMMTWASAVVFPPDFLAIGNFAVSMILNLFYFGFIQTALEGSPGKRVMGLTLVSESLGKLTLSQTMMRWFVHMVGTYAMGLGLLWVAWDKRKQGWHDKAAKTLVLRTDFVQQVRRQMSMQKMGVVPIAPSGRPPGAMPPPPPPAVAA